MSKVVVRSWSVALAVAVMFPIAASAQFDKSERKKIAHFHLSGAMSETPREDPFGLSGGKAPSLKRTLERLAKARKDDDVRAIVLTMSSIGLGSAQLEELRDELKKFKAIDKRVFVHVDSLNTGLYALASAATDLSIVPTADVWLNGFYAEGMYLKHMLTKIGCEADIVHIGDYKSAGETFYRSGPSEAAQENIDWLLDGLYGSIVDMVADARGMSSDKVRKIIDNGPYSAEKALELGLIDSVKYRDEFIDEINAIYGDDVEIDNRYAVKDGPKMDFSNPFAMFSIFGDMFGGGKKKNSAPAVGIVYVDGAIVTGFGEPSPFGGSSGAFSGDIERALREAETDKSIKAVVLRVNSPGGSALASEIILRAAKKVQAKKPLIVSMGNVAASGGYYVAMGADMIFADETTITGSIGVVGGKIVTAGLWNKLGVDWVPHARGANADIMNTLEPFSERQRTKIHDWMSEIYDIFKGHVTACRGDKLSKPIDKLASGRVFTGKQAVENGLVDKIGGFHDAIEFAARQAKISDYDVRVVPEPKDFFQTIFQELSGEGKRPTDLTVRTQTTLFSRQSALMDMVLPLLRQMEPARAAALTQALTRLELIHKEGVITMLPFEFVIR